MGKAFLFLVVALSAYGVVSCTISDREKEKAREAQKAELDRKDILQFSIIKQKKKEYYADTSWIQKFGIIGDNKQKSINLYTTQIQDAFLTDRNTLIFGGIEDFSNLNSNTYELTISNTSFELEMRRFIEPKLQFKFTCPKENVDKLISEFNASHKKKIGVEISVAVIGKITSIEDYSYKTSDSDREKGKLITGTCIEALLAPQRFGNLRKNIESL